MSPLAEENDPAFPRLSKQDDRIESSQIDEGFDFVFHIPSLPPPSRKPLRRRAPRASVDGTVTRNLWPGVFDALAATHKNDPIAAQSPRKRAASSPIKPVAERLFPSEEIQESEGGDEGASHEQTLVHAFHSPPPPPTKPSWPSHTPQRQPSPLRILLSQTSNTPSISPTKPAVLPPPPKVPTFISPSTPGVLRSPSKVFSATASPSKYTPYTLQGAPFMTPTRPKFPSFTSPEVSPSTNTFGLTYVSPPKLLPHPGGSTPVSEEVGISQYPESLADEPLPDFLLAFGESQGMEDWIQGIQR